MSVLKCHTNYHLVYLLSAPLSPLCILLEMVLGIFCIFRSDLALRILTLLTSLCRDEAKSRHSRILSCTRRLKNVNGYSFLEVRVKVQ